MLRRTFLTTMTAAPLLCGAEQFSLFDGQSLKGWKSEKAHPQGWTVENGILTNGPGGKVNNLYTATLFGDLELEVEFRIPAKSNSGIYLHGLYEVQIFDSYGKAKITTQDSGSIYHRWIDEKPVGGTIAKKNAAKPAGEWQNFQILFRAPRFDAAGKKTAPARFEWVRYNGVQVQENAICEGPTRAHMDIAESARNPLMLQGDHGPVEFRKIGYRVPA
ncbi:MAG: DUF1080 domain-containing protein [Bryobacter sp.]|nr:DUF1080 domain-containing protein [Bryobacter sp.]